MDMHSNTAMQCHSTHPHTIIMRKGIEGQRGRINIRLKEERNEDEEEH